MRQLLFFISAKGIGNLLEIARTEKEKSEFLLKSKCEQVTPVSASAVFFQFAIWSYLLGKNEEMFGAEFVVWHGLQKIGGKCNEPGQQQGRQSRVMPLWITA